MNVEQVFETLGSHAVLTPESRSNTDRMPVQDVDPGEWHGRRLAVFCRRSGNADCCWARFDEDRLIDFELSPD